MNYEKLTDDEVSKLESIERRLKKIDKEIAELGLTPLIHDGILAFVKEEKGVHPMNDQIMHDMELRAWGSIEW